MRPSGSPLQTVRATVLVLFCLAIILALTACGDEQAVSPAETSVPAEAPTVALTLTPEPPTLTVVPSTPTRTAVASTSAPSPAGAPTPAPGTTPATIPEPTATPTVTPTPTGTPSPPHTATSTPMAENMPTAVPTPAIAQASLRLTPSSGAAGDQVTVEGAGFPQLADVSFVFLKKGPRLTDVEWIEAPGRTSEDGEFSGVFVVPSSTLGTYDFSVVVRHDTGLAQGTAEFTVLQSLAATPVPTRAAGQGPRATPVPAATRAPASGESMFAFQWMEGNPSSLEQSAMIFLRNLENNNPDRARVFLEFPWLADGLTVDEYHAFENVYVLVKDGLSESQLDLVRILLGTPSLSIGGVGAVLDLDSLGRQQPELVSRILSFPWLADGVDANERWVISAARAIAQKDVPLAHLLMDSEWLADGVSQDEGHGLRAVTTIAEWDVSLAGAVMNLPWMADGISREEQWGLTYVSMIANDRGLTELLLAYPWFRDGLSEDEGLLADALTRLEQRYGSRRVIANPHFLSDTFTAPSAVEVEVVVLQPYPFQDGDRVLEAIRRGAGEIGAFMAGQWSPVPRVYVYLDTEWVSEARASTTGQNSGALIVSRVPEEASSAFSFTLHHEYAHYYFGNADLPIWLSEGAADFLARYIRFKELTESGSMYQRALSRVEQDCEPHGVTKIHELTQAMAGLTYDEAAGSSPLFLCNYALGESFLWAMYESLGPDSVIRSLREIRRMVKGQIGRLDEDDIYRAFLANAPPDKRDEFLDVYRRVHGRPIG